MMLFRTDETHLTHGKGMEIDADDPSNLLFG